MDRFEVNSELSCKNLNSHLHSSMDRFEDLVDFKESTLKNIYIPVWIDLKQTPCVCVLTCVHLHSSMDRFEAC